MPRKRILIDLSKLRQPMCGLGQIALNYGRWYALNARTLADRFDITLLVPKDFVGAFGNDVHYLVAHKIYTFLPSLLPQFDLWHAIHQRSPFRPPASVSKYILTIHDVNFIHEKGPFKQRRYTRQLQSKCDRATHITFISRFAMEDTLHFINLHDKPVDIIYNGVEQLTEGPQQEPVQLSSIHSASLNLPPDAPFFLAIGEVKEKKQLHTLLPLMDRLPSFRLLIAGNDNTPYARQLRSRLRQHPNVNIIGIVSDSQRRWLYSHCTALLFPSVAEGFGLPLIEAMQWGKPVFCSDRTSLPEIGSTHAYYFRDFDPDHMAELVNRGLAEYNDTKALAAQNYAASFSYEKHMQKYIDLYLADNRE